MGRDSGPQVGGPTQQYYDYGAKQVTVMSPADVCAHWLPHVTCERQAQLGFDPQPDGRGWQVYEPGLPNGPPTTFWQYDEPCGQKPQPQLNMPGGGVQPPYELTSKPAALASHSLG